MRSHSSDIINSFLEHLFNTKKIEKIKQYYCTKSYQTAEQLVIAESCFLSKFLWKQVLGLEIEIEVSVFQD